MPSKRTEFIAKLYGNFFEETVTTSAGIERDVVINMGDLLPDELKVSITPCHVVAEFTITKLGPDPDPKRDDDDEVRDD
jgi:hypothetical protein